MTVRYFPPKTRSLISPQADAFLPEQPSAAERAGATLGAMLRRLAQPGTLHARLRPPPLLRLRPTVPAFASGCRRARSTLSSATGAASASAAGPEIASAAPLRRWLTATKVPLLNLSISDLFGHAAFALAGTAFLDPDILNLR